ncbi:protein ALWAYS EARLY 2-like isoform X2 [Iris pallida]|uniref:Protein ALWAYS EARLY 2-like isoform X2 n=1 Tax=Iris pallida TaxID=29817 RepID=A0AAX6HA66_IRIPA|nr:protein ALWAYS EARLY 2-like isoform X2 [Iris pallida]
MASTRKSRNVNKRYGKINDEWLEKDGTSASKSRTRKRKMSDMLGPQWSKEELERFYEAYRKYGKDWRKVSGMTRNRSLEMVEALYNKNKAYLSLPEGTATVAGLIAMTTDHYNILEGSESDRESNDVPRTSRKPQKRGRGKYRLISKGSEGPVPDLLQYQSTPTSYGCLPLLKKKRSGGSRPRAVGKRTPRIPVTNMCSKDGKDKIFSPCKQAFKSELSTAADEGAHVAALALAEASQKVGSPQVSQTPGRRGDHMRLSPVRSGERKNAELEVADSRTIDVQMNADNLEGSLGSREAENGEFARDTSYMIDTYGARTLEIHQKTKKPHEKRPIAAGGDNDQFDDDREACSGTEEGSNLWKIKDERNMETAECKIAKVSKGSRKKSRELFFDNESSAFDALQTLADLSLHMLLPPSTVESESSAQVKEEDINFDIDEKPGLPESVSTNHLNDRSKGSEKKEGVHSTNVGNEVVTRKGARVAKGMPHNANALCETILETSSSINRKIQKRKRKSFFGKVSKTEVNRESRKSSESRKSEPMVTDASVEEGKKYVQKVKRVSQVNLLARQGKLSKSQEHPSSSTDVNKTATDINETSVRISTKDQVRLPTKLRSQRKMDLQKSLSGRESKSNESTGEDCPVGYSLAANKRLLNFKEMLSHCLSSPMVRRWCAFEWFYSAIDYPWFAKTEFVEYLNHVKLGHIPRLTRVEWGVIRSSLGKPRRLSKKFLQEEREKLEQYRESVRTHYAELRIGVREGLPTDLARPLSVGQRVSACHPKTREIHDGSVLTVDRSRFRIQFDRPELGVEFVMDVDCMPLNPLENMPEGLERQNVVMNKFCNNFTDTKVEDQPKEWKIGGSMKLAPNESADIADMSSYIASSNYSMKTLMKQAMGDTIDAIVQAKAAVNEVVAAQQAMYSQPYTLAQIQAREADIKALAELARSLDKKEALLVELRHMNEEVCGCQKDSGPIMDLENFRKHYALVLLQLRDANDQVASCLIYMRQRNTYPGNSTPPWHKPMESSGGPATRSFSHSALLTQDSGSNVLEIIHSSRRKARLMVEVAVEVADGIKEGEDVFIRIREALDLVNNRNSGSSSSISTIRHIPPGLSSSPRLNTSNDINEVQPPSELISSCVATLFMIQTCAERQYPPAEVAQILDSAVTSLQPCCQQNLPIYKEIETCMGIIKNQMLALIPTPSSLLPVEASIA